jgi:hypothetical protein
MSGLSDVRVLGSYTIFGNREVGDNSTIFLEVGAGMKLPTGRYDANIHDSNLPENFNLGNGSFGYIFQPNFVWKYKKNGLVFNGNYTYNQSSESGYHFGSQISSQILLFREFSLTSSLKLIPNIGTQYERIGVDTYNNGNSVHGTGGEGIFGAGGLTVRYKSLRASFTYSEPLQEDYSQGEVEAQRRLSAQLTFNF